jgi:hypothetical protein
VKSATAPSSGRHHDSAFATSTPDRVTIQPRIGTINNPGGGNEDHCYSVPGVITFAFGDQPAQKTNQSDTRMEWKSIVC